jgi:hypothetical protein
MISKPWNLKSGLSFGSLKRRCRLLMCEAPLTILMMYDPQGIFMRLIIKSKADGAIES